MARVLTFNRARGGLVTDDSASVTTGVKQNLDGTLTPTTDLNDPLLLIYDATVGRPVPRRQVVGGITLVTTGLLQLANGLQLSWAFSAAIVLYTVWVQRGGRLFYPVAFGTGTSWTDPEVADGETVRYQVTGVDSSGNSSLILDVIGTQAPRTYLDPLVITQPGTYSGNYNNDDPAGHAVKVNAGVQGVNLVNMRLRSRNNAIRLSSGSATNIQNVVGWARHPLVSNRTAGKFIDGQAPASVIAQHVAFEGFSLGFYVDGQSTQNCQKILLQYWRSRNVECRRTNATGYDQVKNIEGHAAQVNGCRAVAQYDILDGDVIQEYQVGLVNDTLNNYASSGLSGRKAQIARNVINGLWPLDGTADPSTALGGQSGCGIISDGDSDGTALQNGNIEISNNLILASSNYGIGVANGNTLDVHHNQVITTGYLPDGTTVNRSTNGGLYVTAAYSGTPNSTLSNATVHDNTVMCWNLIGSRNKPPGNNNGFIYNNAYDFSQVGQNGNTQTNNATDNRTADVALERAAYLNFVQSQSAAGRTAGISAF